MALVGEAPSDEELARGRPFVGHAGRLLNSVLHAVGISRWDCLVTNVFDFKLPGNKVKRIAHNMSAALHDFKLLRYNSPWERHMLTPVDSGAYVPMEVLEPQLNRLWAELFETQPNVVVALGATAAWALHATNPYGRMKRLRGSIAWSIPFQRKTLITYHPAYIARNWQDRPLLLADLAKANRSADSPHMPPLDINIIVPETAGEVVNYFERQRTAGRTVCAVDIETSKGQIDTIGFAFEENEAIAIPLAHTWGGSYWTGPMEESIVMGQIISVLMDEHIEKVMQNGSGYDVQWIWEKWHIPVFNYRHDTRLAEHAWQPELPKDLATIGSLHLNLPAWKLSGGARTKRDE